MSELLPCPHCPESHVNCVFDEVSYRYRVYCGACGASTGIHPTDKTPAPAIAAWNRRTPPSVGEDARLDAARLGQMRDFVQRCEACDIASERMAADLFSLIDAAMKEGK